MNQHWVAIPGSRKRRPRSAATYGLATEDDQPPARVVEETSEDDVDSHGADRAAGYEDDDLDDEDGTIG